MVGPLLVGPAFLTDLAFDKDFLSLLRIGCERLRGFPPQLEVDEGTDAFAFSRLSLIVLVIGESDFNQAFAVFGFDEFGIGDQIAAQQEFVDIHKVDWRLLGCFLFLLISTGEERVSVMPAQWKFQTLLLHAGKSPQTRTPQAAKRNKCPNQRRTERLASYAGLAVSLTAGAACFQEDASVLVLMKCYLIVYLIYIFYFHFVFILVSF
jgi:hypothetical protein